MSQESLVRSLGLKEAASLVVGTVIGMGVFVQAAGMTQLAGSPFWVLAAWVVGGLLSLCGALCYAELGGMFPKAGGDYVFLREAYGGCVAFLFGWMRFCVVSPGSMAAFAVGASTFLAGSLGLDANWKRSAFAVGMIAAFSALNCFSVALGGRVQGFLTAVKLVLIIGLAGSIFAFGGGSASLSNFSSSIGGGGFPGWTAFGATIIAALFAYDGWNNMPMAAGEIKNPGRNIPIALGLGLTVVVAIYIFLNAAYFFAMPAADVAASYSAAHADALPAATRAAQAAFGGAAVAAFSGLFAFSALGALNGAVLASARVPFAMARDGLFFRKLGEVTHSTRAPVNAIIAQGAVTAALAASGTFEQLAIGVVFSAWIFYILAAASVFILRKKMPDARREFRVPLYPWLPILFIISAALLLASSLATSPVESCLGGAFTLAGIPVYLAFRRSAPAR